MAGELQIYNGIQKSYLQGYFTHTHQTIIYMFHISLIQEVFIMKFEDSIFSMVLEEVLKMFPLDNVCLDLSGISLQNFKQP